MRIGLVSLLVSLALVLTACGGGGGGTPTPTPSVSAPAIDYPAPEAQALPTGYPVSDIPTPEGYPAP